MINNLCFAECNEREHNRFYTSSFKFYQANNYCNLVLERKTVSNNRI